METENVENGMCHYVFSVYMKNVEKTSDKFDITLTISVGITFLMIVCFFSFTIYSV